MTDPNNEANRAERLERLQARRAASSPTRVRVASSESRGDVDRAPVPPIVTPRSRAPRRRHPAARSRWLVGGLSVASFLVIGGTVAAASANTAASPTTVVAPVTANAVATTSASAASATASPAAKAATPAAHVAHTKTRGS